MIDALLNGVVVLLFASLLVSCVVVVRDRWKGLR